MTSLNFNLPTLVTITAPTCAGKSYLLEALVKNEWFSRIVSTTDRAPRDGEVQSVHYDFISTEKSKQLEADDMFAELVTYNGVRYGVTHDEMTKAMKSALPPMVILEPRGLEMYRKYCGTHRWQMFSIYVETPENVRLDRLAKRTTNDIMKVVSNNNWFSDVGPYRYTSAAEVITQLIQTNNKRLKAVLDEERQWSHTNRWDVQVDGTNLEKSLEYIKHAIQNRNNRQDIYK